MPGIDELLANPPSLDPRILQSNPLEDLQASALGLQIRESRAKADKQDYIVKSARDNTNKETGEMDTEGFIKSIGKKHPIEAQRYKQVHAAIEANISSTRATDTNRIITKMQGISQIANGIAEAREGMTEEQQRSSFTQLNSLINKSDLGIDTNAFISPEFSTKNLDTLTDVAGMMGISADTVFRQKEQTKRTTVPTQQRWQWRIERFKELERGTITPENLAALKGDMDTFGARVSKGEKGDALSWLQATNAFEGMSDDTKVAYTKEVASLAKALQSQPGGRYSDYMDAVKEAHKRELGTLKEKNKTLLGMPIPGWTETVLDDTFSTPDTSVDSSVPAGLTKSMVDQFKQDNPGATDQDAIATFKSMGN